MSDFKSFLSGKRVALVGPASTLLGEGRGAFIDGHDVVVRLNHAWPLPEDLKKDVGSRIDVIYHNLNPNCQRIRRRDIKSMHRDGVQWIVSTHPWRERRFRGRLLRFCRLNRGLLRFRAIPGSLKRRMCRQVRHPNCGLMAIEDLLRHPIESLYVTGFSFYTTGYLNYPNYKKRFLEKAVRHHNQDEQKRYLAALLDRDNRLAVDPVIAQLVQQHKAARATRIPDSSWLATLKLF